MEETKKTYPKKQLYIKRYKDTITFRCRECNARYYIYLKVIRSMAIGRTKFAYALEHTPKRKVDGLI